MKNKDHYGYRLDYLSEDELEEERLYRESIQAEKQVITTASNSLQVKDLRDGPYFVQKCIPYLNPSGEELDDKTLCLTLKDQYGNRLADLVPYNQEQEWRNRESIQIANQVIPESKMLELQKLVGASEWKKANDSFNKRFPNFVYNGHIPFWGKRYKSYREYLSNTYPSEIISMSIADSVTELPAEVFKDCDTIKRVTIHDKVTNIGNGAFAGCTNLLYVLTNLSLWPLVLENLAAEENSLQQLTNIVRNNLDSILQMRNERLYRPNTRNKREEDEVDAFEDNAIHSVDSDSIAQNLEQVPSCSSTSDDAPLPF